jgi:hypothetical protein
LLPGTSSSARNAGSTGQAPLPHDPRSAKVPNVPPGSRVIDLNRRRNTSVDGEWLEVIDQDAPLDAIKAARNFLAAVRRGLTTKEIQV